MNPSDFKKYLYTATSAIAGLALIGWGLWEKELAYVGWGLSIFAPGILPSVNPTKHTTES